MDRALEFSSGTPLFVGKIRFILRYEEEWVSECSKRNIWVLELDGTKKPVTISCAFTLTWTSFKR